MTRAVITLPVNGLRRASLRGAAWPLAFGLLLVGTVAMALSVGKYPISIGEVMRFPFSAAGLINGDPGRYADLRNVLIDIRLPRVLTAVLVGAALSTSGAAYQAVFRNPLVSPGLLGVLAGASFGAALGILLNGSWMEIQVLAFGFGLAAVGIGVAIGSLFGSTSIITLVLGGMVSNALFSSLLSVAKYVADPMNQLPAIVYWLMGNLGQPGLTMTAWMSIPILTGVIGIAMCGRALDALAMGDDEARSLGVPVAAVRYCIIAAATMVSALTVSLAGMIGWVGLIIPHIVRLMLGPGNGRLLPASALLGAAFLVAADTLGRTASVVEIPIGIVTELFGIPIFLLVLSRSRKGWL